MKLSGVLPNIFRTRGYEILFSSEDEGYLLLRKNGSTLAVGFKDPGCPAAVEEVRTFVKKAGQAGADSMLFVSPERLRREQKRILDGAKAATWDRMALAIAIGEYTLMAKGDKDSSTEVPVFDPGSIMCEEAEGPDLPFQGERDEAPEGRVANIDDMEHGSVQGSGGAEQDDGELVVKKISFPKETGEKTDGMGHSEPPAAETPTGSLPHPDQEIKKIGKDGGSVMTSDRAQPDEAPSLMESFENIIPVGASPAMSGEEQAEDAKDPWEGSILAPLKYSVEEACQKAGVPPDTELHLEHHPYLLVGVSYALRSETGKRLQRSGYYLYEHSGSGLMDIPEAVAEELRSCLDTWDRTRGTMVHDSGPDDDRGHVRALRDRLSREVHTEDHLVKETLMSTIYQEVRYLFDPASFDIRWSKRVVIPFWTREGTDGTRKWMVDAYLGRYIPLNTGQD